MRKYSGGVHNTCWGRLTQVVRTMTIRLTVSLTCLAEPDFEEKEWHRLVQTHIARMTVEDFPAASKGIMSKTYL